MAIAPKVSFANVTQIRNVRRKPRRPQHRFNLKTKPYQIQPFLIAPVLPGETMQNLLLQSHVVTDPVLNRLVGWWKEYYFFYVPHLALTADDPDGLLRAMMLDPTTNVSTMYADGNLPAWYTFEGGIDFVQYCQHAVVSEFFRDEDEDLGDSIDGMHTAQIDQQQWWNSAKLESAGADDLELPGVDDIEELDILPSHATAYAQWELMRDAGMIDQDYDDFIRSYGVDIPKAQEVENREVASFRPELLRFSRSWKYPVAAIDPADGSATAAVKWEVAERADKSRFFKYPGFIFGVTVTRPKLYLGNQKGAAVGFLNNAYSWLPAVLHGHVYSSIKEIVDSGTVGPWQNQSEDYWFDCKDLFLYGDQFVNYAMDVAHTNSVAMPTATLGLKYPTEAMVDALFVTAGTDYVYEDGTVHLNVLGKLSETTP